MQQNQTEPASRKGVTPCQIEFDFGQPRQLALPGCKPPAYVRVDDRAPAEGSTH